MKAEIRDDFAEILDDIGEDLIVESTGTVVRGAVAPMDISRTTEIGGYVDKNAFEVTIPAVTKLAIGERLLLGGVPHRVAKIDKDIISNTQKLYITEV